MGIFNFGKRKEYIPRLPVRSDFATSISQTYSTKESQLDANINAVAVANDIISETCSTIELRLYKKRGDKAERVTESPILDLLNNPNNYTSGEQLRQLFHTYMNLVGESYFLKIGNGKLPDALIVLPAHLVDTKLEKEYEASTITYNNVSYPITDVIRGINPDPKNPQKGRSIIKATAQSIAIDRDSKDWNANFYANSARPSLIVEVPDVLDNENFKRFKQEFNENFVGKENQGKPLIVEGGATVKEIMNTQKDMDFLNSQKFTRTEILSMFRVPPALLGEVTDSNRANTEAAEYIFSKYTIKPKIEAFVDVINQQLVKPYDPTLELSYESPVPKDKKAEIEELRAGVNNWLTIDEVRAVNGLDPLPNSLGAILYRPYGEVPLGTPYATPTEQKLKEELGKKSRPVYIHKQTDHMRESRGEFMISKIEKSAQQYEIDFLIVSRKHFDEQRLLAIKIINNIDKKKDFKKKDLDFYGAEWTKLTENYALALSVLYERLIETQGKEALTFIGSSEAFDWQTDEIQDYIKSRATLVSTIVDDETEKQLRAIMIEGLDKGKSIKELTADMESVFGNAVDYRARRIARTESIKNANQGNIFAWQQTDGFVQGKQFYTSRDARVCPFCNEMDGKIIGLAENYYEKGEQMTVDVEQKDGSIKSKTLKFGFEDISSPPLHVNCRCTLLPITEDI